MVNIQFGNLASFIFKCNLASKDITQTYFNLDSFWQEVLLYWCEYNFEDINIQEINESIIKQPLWYNSNIKHENQTLFLKKMYSKGIINIVASGSFDV